VPSERLTLATLWNDDALEDHKSRRVCSASPCPRVDGRIPGALADGRADEREHLGLEVRLVALCQRAQGSAEEDGESMDGRPRRVLDVWATSGRQDSGFNEVVESRLQMVERCRLVDVLTGRVIAGGRECGVEEAWFLACELEIGLADGPESEPGACRCVRPGTYLVHAVGHALSELSDRLVADRREERIAVGEMPIGGVGDDPDHARDLAQHDRVRPSRSREREASLDERRPDSATATRSPARRRIACLRVSWGPLITCRHLVRA